MVVESKAMLVTSVQEAIDRSEFTWRSISALSRNVGRDESEIIKAVSDHPGFRTRIGKNGTMFVTTLEKYHRDVPMLYKAYSAFVNRVA